MPSEAACFFTMCQTAFFVMLDPQTFPVCATQRKSLPSIIPADAVQRSTACFTQSGTGTVLMCPHFPIMSTVAQ